MSASETKPGENQAVRKPFQGAPPRRLGYEELEQLADRILARMKKDMRQDLQREGRHV